MTNDPRIELLAVKFRNDMITAESISPYDRDAVMVWLLAHPRVKDGQTHK